MVCHHNVNEEDILHQCAYCGINISDFEWLSEFFGSNHYKVTSCTCGKENRVKIQFCGSGHDNFNQEKNLEMKIEHYRFDKSFFK